MILYINTKITDDRLSKHFTWPRGLLRKDNAYDVFRYSLASFAVLPLTKVVLNVVLDATYTDKKHELQEYIESVFGNTPIKLRWTRNENQKEWQQDIDKEILCRDYVWYLCNSDHIFIDRNLDVVNEALFTMNLQSNPFTSLFYSHWSELLQIAITHNAQKNGNLLQFHWQNIDSIQLMSAALLRAIWFNYDYKGAHMPRSDWHTQAKSPLTAFFAPTRELVRHYDSSSHVGVSINDAPPLVIPPGFFDKKIKIRYGYNSNKADCVNLNPSKVNFTTVDKEGTDFKWCYPTDIPLFWRDRISDVDISPLADEQSMLMGRNLGVLQLAAADKRYAPPPSEWLMENLL